VPVLLRRIRPAQAVALGFLAAILVGTLLLTIPVCRAGPGGAPFDTALFTATSAVTVTGLAVVDTATYWTTGGQVVIMLLVQLGGLGIMSATTLLVMLVGRRIGLRARMLAQTETAVQQPGEVRRVLVAVALLTLVVEAVCAVGITIRLWAGGDDLGTSAWYGMFHAVTAFNNAGFALWPDNLVQFAGDLWMSGIMCVAIIAGGLGVPVFADLVRRPRTPRRWSLHTRLTLIVSAVLIVFGTAAVIAFEWGNPGTLGALSPGDRLIAGAFQGISPRTAGFNTVDYAQMNDSTLLVTDFLMLVGAGSVSTGGGIKVTTLCVLALAAAAAVRGTPSVNALGRRIPDIAQRQALAITVIATGAIAIGTFVLVAASGVEVGAALFETTSALGTVGLSTGITGDLGIHGDAVLIALMILGRVGPQVLGAALVMREREPRYRYPEERPIVG
jgi:potassium uptake TrkH family protein